MLREWMHEVQDELGRASLLAAQARRMVDEAQRARRSDAAELRGLVDEAEAMIEVVEKGKGAHNYELSLTLLEEATARLQEAIGDPARVAESP